MMVVSNSHHGSYRSLTRKLDDLLLRYMQQSIE